MANMDARSAAHYAESSTRNHHMDNNDVSAKWVSAKLLQNCGRWQMGHSEERA